MRQEYLGDGAYVTIDRDFKGQVILTANHHDEEQATDKIHLDTGALNVLVRICKQEWENESNST